MAGVPKGLAVTGWSRGGVALLAVLVLGGCDGGLGLRGGGEADTPSGEAAPERGTAAADVAAPEVFQVTESGLWDGRPSLGGVWVAHPDATDPERVRVVNTENGQEIVGALFRRERDLPGPALQVSSDAAEALGMLAGAPVSLSVTALRRQGTPDVAPTPTPDTDAEASPEPAAAPEPEAAPVTATQPVEPTPPAPVDPAAVEAVTRATAAILAALPEEPAEPAPAAPVAIATTALAPADGAAPAPAPADAPLTAMAPAAPSAEVSAAPAPSGPLRYPFVQLATFSAEETAARAAQALAAKGLPARVVPVDGQASWRLLLGPATTEAQQEGLRAQAVAEGYADAFLVRG